MGASSAHIATIVLAFAAGYGTNSLISRQSARARRG